MKMYTVAKLDVFDGEGGGRKTYIPKISIESGGQKRIYIQKFLYENYIYNTTERKVRGSGAPPGPFKASPMDVKFLYMFI
ncbi:hypothetical protein Hanom_Chr09g00811151 [Helianthus anomalus]